MLNRRRREFHRRLPLPSARPHPLAEGFIYRRTQWLIMVQTTQLHSTLT